MRTRELFPRRPLNTESPESHHNSPLRNVVRHRSAVQPPGPTHVGLMIAPCGIHGAVLGMMNTLWDHISTKSSYTPSNKQSSSIQAQLSSKMSHYEATTTAIPPMKDLTTENITENVHIVNSQCRDPRLRYLLERIVTHLHEFCRETRLSTEEWQAGIQFLTEIGQISDDLRHEMILLSDTLGVSLLVDSINHPRHEPATEGTVLGPFHTHDAEEMDNGAVLHNDPDATPLLVLCSVKDTEGRPLDNVKIDVWEGDSKGFYDVQNPNRSGPDGRGVLHSDSDGLFFFKASVPVPYPIPMDGPVGKMLQNLGRHPNRPGHVHFMLDKPGYDLLIT